MTIPNARVGILTVATVTSLVLAACGQGNQYVAPPPPKVTVATPVQRPITRYLEVTGSTGAVNSADLVARVPGFVQEISYSDGALVKKGTLLFTIEPEPYEVKLPRANPPTTRRWPIATPPRPTSCRPRPTPSWPRSITTTPM